MEKSLYFGLSGENVKFGKFSMTKFLEISSLYYSLLIKIMKFQNPNMNFDNLDFIIQNIRDGSIDVTSTCTMEVVAAQAYETFINACENNNQELFSNIDPENLSSLGNKLAQSDAVLILKKDNGETVEIHPEVLQVKSKVIKEYMTLYGELLQIGGKNPNAHIKSMLSEKTIICDVTQEQARALGSRLYQIIGLKGIATISLPKYDINKFLVKEILPYQETDKDKNIEKLKQIFSDQVKDIDDVDAFFRKIREG